MMWRIVWALLSKSQIDAILEHDRISGARHLSNQSPFAKLSMVDEITENGRIFGAKQLNNSLFYPIFCCRELFKALGHITISLCRTNRVVKLGWSAFN